MQVSCCGSVLEHAQVLCYCSLYLATLPHAGIRQPGGAAAAQLPVSPGQPGDEHHQAVPEDRHLYLPEVDVSG